MLTESCVIFFAVPSRLRRYFAGRGVLQNAERRNAERRMMVSGKECETGRYIIYDKLMSYTPNLT